MEDDDPIRMICCSISNHFGTTQQIGKKYSSKKIIRSNNKKKHSCNARDNRR
jgi:hypothetical protein